LTSVSENSTGGDAKPYYIDGVKYLNLPSPEEFEATLTAFTYPDEFEECDGSHQPRAGLFVTRQQRKSFGLSYRSMIGNDQGKDYAYKIHLIYNALASPSTRDRRTRSESTSLDDFSWKITTCPPAITGYTRTSHFVIDSRYTDPDILALIEDKLYGSETDPSGLPTVDELIAIYDTISGLVVTDNGDGTWTATAPNDVIRMLDDTTFEVTAATAVFLDTDSYTLSSS
jgi:hypothetical protein